MHKINKTARVAGTLLGLSAIAVMLVAGVAFLAAMKVDELSLSRERLLVHHSLEGLVAAVPREQASVSTWDDAVVEIGNRNAQWMRDNYGSWLRDYFNIDRSYILDPSGKLLFAMVDGKDVDGKKLRNDPAVGALATKLRDEIIKAQTVGFPLADLAVVKVVSVEGRPAVISVRPILPSTSRITVLPSHMAMSAVVKFFDNKAAARMAEHVQLQGLTFSERPGDAATAAVPITSGDGQTLGYFSWIPLSPGVEMLKAMAPAALIGMLIAGGAAVILSFSLVRASHRLVLSREELLRHKEELEATVELRTREVQSQARELDRLLSHEREVNEMQRQLVAMTSHEFRTPLAIIDGAAQRLVRSNPSNSPQMIDEKATQIRNAVKRMVDLMESVLSAAKFRAGKLQLEVADCDLRATVLECCEHHASLAKDTHQIEFDIHRLPTKIRADKNLLERAVSNLISNAVKYAPKAPKITVTGWVEGSKALIAVRDEGPGIEQSDIAKLFTPYFRAGNVSGIAGTGIGLTFVKNIAELHSGSASVESKLGVGTTFTIAVDCENAPRESDKRAA